MSRVPDVDEILIREAPDGLGVIARLLTDNGYIVRIDVPAGSKETGMMILHEYLDELGYNDKLRVDEDELPRYDLFDGKYH